MGVDYTVGAQSFHSVVTTLSGGGLFIQGSLGLEPGKEIPIRFSPFKRRPAMEVRAVVRYILAGRGTAVEFTEIDPGDRQSLLRLIHQKTGDRRLFARAPLATQLECDRCLSLAFSRDVSLAGMFIETSAPLPVGSILQVRFNLNNKDKVVKATAQVTYDLEKIGMGVVFTEIEPLDREAIRDYVENTPSPPQRNWAISKADS
jgi:c-di-GMP-binding flagellar brake protein YcgR